MKVGDTLVLLRRLGFWALSILQIVPDDGIQTLDPTSRFLRLLFTPYFYGVARRMDTIELQVADVWAKPYSSYQPNIPAACGDC